MSVPVKGGSRSGSTISSVKPVVHLWNSEGQLETYKLTTWSGRNPFYMFVRVRRTRSGNETTPKRGKVVDLSNYNLSALAADIAREEGLQQSVGVAQVSEIIGILGKRWRAMKLHDAMGEARAIRERAGLRSEHEQ